MVRWLYSWVMILAQPLLRHKLRRRSQKEPLYGHQMQERFGHYASETSKSSALPSHAGPTLWVHAVSLGETRAAAILIAALRELLPELRLLLTHGTATGRAEGASLLAAGDLQVWQPWDTPRAVELFLNHFEPDLGILIETEVWPNLVALCQQQGVPLLLVNARLSEKSLHQAQRLAWLARPAFAALTGVWAQTEQDASRLQSLGAKVKGVLGNIKFDAKPNAAQLAQGKSWRARLGKPVVMLASSREGEELALLESLKDFEALALSDKERVAINSIVDNVHWLIVPRHPQRFDSVADLMTAQGFEVGLRSGWGQGGPGADAAPQTIWLGDSLGEMALYYGMADVALLGGSFEPLGGQNLIEAAACGCPVVMGPHTFNFAQAADLALAAGAAVRVPDLPHAVEAAKLLAGGNKDAQKAALAFARAHQGSARQIAKAVVSMLHGSCAKSMNSRVGE